MSKHWDPGSTGWLSNAQFRALSPQERRSLDFQRSLQRHEHRFHPKPARSRKGQRGSWPAGATAGLVLLAAACAGLVVGLYQAAAPPSPVQPEAKIEWGAVQPVRRAQPETADAADVRWQRRAQGQDWTPEQVRGSGARTPGVRVAFSYCKWGGGTNCVVDGDTFYIGGQKVRIAGIDAPETHDYRCASELALGDRATEQLRALLNSGAVTMTSIDRDRDIYGRLLRDVQVNGADVGAAMVSAGVARDYAGGRRPWC